jgi:EmrB/QacA subfamily drug resistance transporter
VAASVLGSAMATIDATVVGIALPSIGREFGATVGQLQWVVNGYTLTLASFLLLGGSLGDRFGRRRVFTVGVVWFTVASAACAAAPGAPALVGLRVLQGIGGALLTPGSLAILQASFVTEDRGRAIGAWTGLGGVAAAAGPLLGGLLVAAASWRWIFLVNLPLGAVTLVLAVRHVPESSDPGAPHHLDLRGAGLGCVALAGVTYGLGAGPARGWGDPLVVASLAVGAASAVGFVLEERRSAAPMLPPDLFRRRTFTVVNLVTFVVYGALGGMLVLLPATLQVVGGYSPLASGAALLPLTALMLVLSGPSGQLAGRIGPRLQLTVGPVVVGGGLALLARVPADPSYVSSVLPAVLVFGLGLACTVAPLTAAALGAVPDRRAGVASAVNNTVARAAGLLAVAVLPALAGITGSGGLEASDLGSGFRRAALIAGGWCALGGLVAALGLRRPSRRPDRTPPVPLPTPSFGCGLDAPTAACPP